MMFRTTIRLEGKTATGIVVPPDVVEALGSGKKPAVNVDINGYQYRSSIAVRGDLYMIPLSAEHRNGAGVNAGDDVDVSLSLDTASREVEVPADLAEHLGKTPAAKVAFEALSYSRKRAIVEPIQQAKTPETRQRRLEKALSILLGS